MLKEIKAPRAGFEPATNRLTVDRSTAELPRNVTLRTYPSAMPYRKGFKATSQRRSVLPSADPSSFHPGGTIGMIQLTQSVGDPESCQGRPGTVAELLDCAEDC